MVCRLRFFRPEPVLLVALRAECSGPVAWPPRREPGSERGVLLLPGRTITRTFVTSYLIAQAPTQGGRNTFLDFCPLLREAAVLSHAYRKPLSPLGLAALSPAYPFSHAKLPLLHARLVTPVLLWIRGRNCNKPLTLNLTFQPEVPPTDSVRFSAVSSSLQASLTVLPGGRSLDHLVPSVSFSVWCYRGL